MFSTASGERLGLNTFARAGRRPTAYGWRRGRPATAVSLPVLRLVDPTLPLPPAPATAPSSRTHGRRAVVASLGLAAAPASLVLARPPAAQARGGPQPWKGDPCALSAPLADGPAAGLRWCRLETGEGPPAPPGSRIRAHYRGTLANGAVFDSSYERGKPLSFSVGLGQASQGRSSPSPGLSLHQSIDLFIFSPSPSIPPPPPLHPSFPPSPRPTRSSRAGTSASSATAPPPCPR